MSDIRLNALVEIVSSLFESPVANARGFAGYEILEINRLILRPHAAGATKIGHPGFGADAGAGEKDDTAGSSQSRGEFFEIHLVPATVRIKLTTKRATEERKVIWAARAVQVSPASAAPQVAEAVPVAREEPPEHPEP